MLLWDDICLKVHGVDLPPCLLLLRSLLLIFQCLFVFLRLRLSQAAPFFYDSILSLFATIHLSFADTLIVPFGSLIALNPIIFPSPRALQVLSEEIRFEILTFSLPQRYYRLLHQWSTFVSLNYEPLLSLLEPIKVVSLGSKFLPAVECVWSG